MMTTVLREIGTHGSCLSFEGSWEQLLSLPPEAFLIILKTSAVP